MTDWKVENASSEWAAAYAAGVASKLHSAVDSEAVAVAVVPGDGGGFRVDVLDLEEKLDAPRRKRGTVSVRDLPSFIAYVQRQKGLGTVICADESGGLTAVLNHHEPWGEVEGEAGKDVMDAGWGDHRCVLTRRQTPSFKAWTTTNRKRLTQLEFAEFLEDRLLDVIQPDGAELYELVRFFQARQKVGFSSARNLTNGQVQLAYNEELEGSGGKAGTIEVPTNFMVRLQPFRDSETFDVAARLRWRLDSQTASVSFTFILDEQLDDRLEEVYDQAITEVQTATDLTVLKGSLG